jgi:hypothetical protein
MPWRCPACHLPIGHSASEDLPRPGAIYRCHVCRIELAVEPKTGKLTAAPVLSHDEDSAKDRTRP